MKRKVLLTLLGVIGLTLIVAAAGFWYMSTQPW